MKSGESKFTGEYIKFLKKNLKVKKPIKIVFDCSNGATGQIIEKLFPNSLIINKKPDGNFKAHSPNPLADGATKQIKKAVIKNKADLGIIFDGDGDRAFFIDSKGEMIDPDIIARLLIDYLKPKKIVVDLRVSWLVRRFKGVKIYESKVGHYFIKKLMIKSKAEFGFEKSGHFYFKKFYYMDGGIMTAVLAVSALSLAKKSLDNYSAEPKKYFSIPETNFKIKNSGKVLDRILQKYKGKAKKIKKIDGLTFEFKNNEGEWWFNLRNSNTEPVLRLTMEATSKSLLNKELDKLTKLIRM